MVAKYPAIPEPTIDPASLRDAVLSLKQAFEVLTGQRGNPNYRALLPEDLVGTTEDVTDNAAAIAANTASISTHTTAIAANTASISTHTTDIAANTASISANATAIATRTVAPDTSWSPFAYQNGWVDYPAPYSPSGYRKLSSGLVVLRGLCMSGTASGILTLPAGYRPGIQLLFCTQTNPNVACRVDITTGGVIQHVGGSNAWISLCGITFLAEL